MLFNIIKAIFEHEYRYRFLIILRCLAEFSIYGLFTLPFTAGGALFDDTFFNSLAMLSFLLTALCLHITFDEMIIDIYNHFEDHLLPEEDLKIKRITEDPKQSLF